jgi:hypothetical protein
VGFVGLGLGGVSRRRMPIEGYEDDFQLTVAQLDLMMGSLQADQPRQLQTFQNLPKQDQGSLA